MEKQELAQLLDKITEGGIDPAYLAKYDVTVLLKLANRLKKYKKDKEKGSVKIAVLGSYSIQHFVGILDVFLTGLGIDANIYEGEYDGIYMDVLDDNSQFYAFEPQIALVLMDDRDIKLSPDCLASEAEAGQLADSQYENIAKLHQKIHQKLPGCQILQTNIVLPVSRALGNMEAGCAYSRHEFLRSINHALAVRHPAYVTIIDMEYLASYAGKKLWFDFSSYFLTKAGYGADCHGMVCAAFARQIAAIRGKNYKCIVLDLDNTLWGGVVGDDGYDGIQIDPHNAVGESYRFFQRYLLELKKRGVILAVCSKNEEDIAKEPFIKNPDMLIKLEDISCFVANWEDKAGNIQRIAKELNIGVDSLVFVDDNPAEREIVKKYLPQVLVVDIPEDPACYVTAVEEANAFSWAQLTKEDLSRSESYAANREREQLMDSFVDYDEYLKALEMTAKVGSPEGAQLQRFVQLINKSNQFNLRTQRYSEADITDMKQDDAKRLLYVELTDKFSEYGIISCIILEKRGSECFIDTWLMSCRVLKRGVEYLALNEVVKAAKEMGCDKIVGEYIATKKNKMVEKFYPSLGFIEISENLYSLDTETYENKKIYIQL